MHRTVLVLVSALVGLVACGKPDDDAVDTDTDTTAVDTDVEHDTGEGDTDDTDDTDVVDTDLGPNHDPTCAITAPLADANPEVGTPVQLGAEMADPDDADPTKLHFAWTSDVDGPIVEGAPNGRGVATRLTTALSFGPQVLTLTVTDGRGGSCTADVAIQVGTPPVAVINAPADDAYVAEGAEVVFRGNVLDVGTLPASLLLAWTSDVDGLLSDAPSGVLGVTTFRDATLSRGDHVITLSATDADGLTGEASITLHVDGVPTAPGVSIAPVQPLTDDDLVATIDISSTDPEGDPITYYWSWTKDGVATAYTGTTVPASATTKGEVWEVSVWGNDGHFDGVHGTASVTVGNTPPTPPEIELSASTILEHSDPLVCSIAAPGTDADGDVLVATFSWSVDGAPADAGDLATTTVANDTVTAAALSDGETWTCSVTVSDGTDASAPAQAEATVFGVQ